MRGGNFGLVGAVAFFDFIVGAAHGWRRQLVAIAREVAGIDLAHRNQRGRVISGLHGVYTIGAAFSPFIGGWLTDMFSFKAAFGGYALATAISVPFGFFVPDVGVPAAPGKPM